MGEIMSVEDDELSQIRAARRAEIQHQMDAQTEQQAQADAEQAAAEHHRMLPIFKIMFTITSPIPVKYSLNQAGFAAGKPRLPLVEPDQAVANRIDSVVANYTIDLPM